MRMSDAVMAERGNPDAADAKAQATAAKAVARRADSDGGPLLFRYVDVLILALALPLFALAGIPLLGWVGAAVIWLLQRVIRDFLEGRARRSDDIRTVAGLTAGSMIARGWIAALLLMGLYAITDADTALAAAVLFLAVFTFYFTMNLAMRPAERLEKGRR
jgi:hypothetical protein